MGAMVISIAAEMSGLDSDRQREVLKKDRITLDDIKQLKQQRSSEAVSESDTENISGEEIWQQEEHGETVSESDTEKVSGEEIQQQEEDNKTVSESDTANVHLAAASDVDMLKTAASSESEHLQSFGAEYTREDVETVYREQTELVQQFEYIMSEGNMTAAYYKRYKKALIIRDGISYILSKFGEGTIC